MNEQPADLAWVQNVLNNPEATQGQPPRGRRPPRQPIPSDRGSQSARERQQRQDRRGDDVQQRRRKPGGHAEQRERKRQSPVAGSSSGRGHGAITGSAAAAVPASAAPPAAAAPRAEGQAEDFSRPGTQSTPRALHCVSCDCWVPRRPGDWETHLRGIRHRRQVLSLRTHGERGRLVLSAFESLPAPHEPAHRLVGKALRDFGLDGGPGSPQQQQQQQQQGRWWAGGGCAAELAALRTAALGQLLSMFGHGNVYHTAAAEFEPARIAAAAPTLLQASEPSHLPPGMATHVAASGSALAAVAWQLQAGSQGDAPGAATAPPAAITTLRLICCTPHESAANPAIAEVEPPQRPTSASAALLVGLVLVLHAARRHASLAHLHLELPHGTYSVPVEQAWRHVLLELKLTLEATPALRSVTLHLPPGLGSLRSIARSTLPALHEAAAAAARPVRQHALLALHPRAGRCSLLQLLPLPLVRAILDLAAPLEPCVIEVP